MTISGFSNAFVSVMLSWLKGFANWVLRLFNLAGSATTSPLYWLSHNWLKLLIFFLVLGVALDRLVWLIRWRPYWVWFRKERIIVNDDKFFAGEDEDPDAEWNDELENNWDERDYVVASTVVRRKDGAKARGSVVKGAKRPSGKHAAGRSGTRLVDRSKRTRVERHVEPQKKEATPARRRRTDARVRTMEGRNRSELGGTKIRRQADVQSSARSADIFEGTLKRRAVADSYEDEVFNVSNLPTPEDYQGKEREK